MSHAETVRKIALSLPQAEDRSTAVSLHFHVGGKQFAWTWHERPAPGKPRQPRLDVLALRCAAFMKQEILASDPEKFFTDDHYAGFPAVLVRLEKIGEKELRALLTSAWECQAPAKLGREIAGPPSAIVDN